MAVESTMLPLGTNAPNLELKDVISGQMVSLSDFVDRKALLVVFACRHCPYVKHVQKGITKIGADRARLWRRRGSPAASGSETAVEEGDSDLGIVAISSNDPAAYPEDAPESLAEQAKELRFGFSYCFDETQEVARAYHAACTPDFFLFDSDRKLVYRGQLDDSRPGNNEPTDGHSLRAAIEAVLSGSKVSEDQKPSLGCSIKWKEA